MRLMLLTAAASALAMGATGCAPRADYAHRTALDCPDRQGELRRTGIAADHKSCTYQSREGAEITLQLIPGNPDDTLSAIEASLVGPANAKSATPGEKHAAPAEPATASADVAKAAAEAQRDAKADGGDWDTGANDKGSVTIKHNDKDIVVGDKDKAHIRLPGVRIDAEGDSATVDIGGIHVNANEDEATVRVRRNVRLRGEAFSREKNGMRATFIAKRDNLPGGYRYVGYEASGPRSGPFTVAIVKSPTSAGHGDGLMRDVQRLVRRNGGA